MQCLISVEPHGETSSVVYVWLGSPFKLFHALLPCAVLREWEPIIHIQSLIVVK